MFVGEGHFGTVVGHSFLPARLQIHQPSSSPRISLILQQHAPADHRLQDLATTPIIDMQTLARLSRNRLRPAIPAQRRNHASVPLARQAARLKIAQIDKNDPYHDPLTDTFGRKHTYLRISLTEKCNLRCVYCMPEEGVSLTPKPELLTTPEILRLARLFVDEGVTKIRLTGGEPTVRKDLMSVVDGLNRMRPFGLSTISMTTNGLALHRKLPELKERGLDQINISLDTLDPFQFELLTRRRGFENVLKSIDEAVRLGFEVKINAVIIRGMNDHQLEPLVGYTRDHNVYVRFIEYMPFDGNKWNHDKFVSYKDMLQAITKSYPDIAKGTDDPHDTSKSYRVSGFSGRFGFITSMSDHFCGTCNRLRLLADGNMKVCLFGNAEVNLRDMVRQGCSDEELLQLIGAAVGRKKKQHAASRPSHSHLSLEAPTSVATRTPPPESRTEMHIHTDFTAIRAKHMPSSTAIGLCRPLVFAAGRSPYTLHSARLFSTKNEQLTHTDAETGKARMVDVSEKNITRRTARAVARVQLSPEAFRLVEQNQIQKGDVLGVASLAGIQAAKQTGHLIPLCHPLLLNSVRVNTLLDAEKHQVLLEALVKCDGKTGVEMEALVAVSIAACTVYDMVKAVDRGAAIVEARVIDKSGGKSGDWSHEG
ncbi:uncharacterized protein BJ171DRAFT_512795 [Polychytrium aggregatum]|uniref:uncharacterized protein n=1 Tax=Polychytrium aggregatum TaxID=110093 RepID=UPI0022FE40D8|nr:uncharacterized protein BJ171DRAFT_512795 [Polychytrium aggregatum]KAI9202639.1 hypothetical protein BJ171DRAFT_512795 [Polychytrium aggregatum]